MMQLTAEEEWDIINSEGEMLELLRQQDRQLALYRELADKNAAKNRILRTKLSALFANATTGEVDLADIDDLLKVVDR